MATPTLDPRAQVVAAEYGVLWQSWPQFEEAGGERRLVGVELV